MSARRTRRSSSSLFPLNMTPAMTSMVPGRARLYIRLGPGRKGELPEAPTIAARGKPVKRGAAWYIPPLGNRPGQRGGEDDQARAGGRAGGATGPVPSQGRP